MTTTARAHTNIALVKYWGKRDDALMLPQTDSLSLTLDEFYTTTTVNFNQALNEDQFYLDGELVSANKAQKVVKFMDLVRQLSGRTEYARSPQSTTSRWRPGWLLRPRPLPPWPGPPLRMPAWTSP